MLRSKADPGSLFALLPLLLLLPVPGRAQGVAPSCGPLALAEARLEARRLLDDAEQAGDRRARARDLEAAYRLYQDPVILYNLGVLWYGAGRRVEGADLLRRYLYEAGEAVSPERRDRLARMLARVPVGQKTSELELSSEPCSFVYVDDRLVGRLPLSLPLLLRQGTHEVEVQRGHRRQRVQVVMGSGQRTLDLRLPATVVLIGEGGAGEDLLAAAAGGVDAEGLTAIAGRARDAIISRTPALRTCLGTQPCQEELARDLQAQYVLVLSSAAGALSARLLDVEAGAVSGVARAPDCPGCGDKDRVAQAAQLARDVLQAGLSAAKGTLTLTSVPEADVVLDGRGAGKTPLLRALLAGRHSLALSAAGYRPREARVQIEGGKTATLSLHLEVDVPPPPVAVAPEPPPAPPVIAIDTRPVDERQPRPRWRLATGGVLTALGAGAATLGALALPIDGECGQGQMMPCARVYHTLVPGAALLGTGAALIVAGVVTLGLPGPRRPRLAAALPGGQR